MSADNRLPAHPEYESDRTWLHRVFCANVDAHAAHCACRVTPVVHNRIVPGVYVVGAPGNYRVVRDSEIEATKNG